MNTLVFKNIVYAVMATILERITEDLKIIDPKRFAGPSDLSKSIQFKLILKGNFETVADSTQYF